MDDTPSSSGSSLTINWDACVLCQTVTIDKLQCPAESKRTDVGQGYTTFVNNFEQFMQLDALPMPLNHLASLNISELANILSDKKAKWHKNCIFLFNKSRLERVIQRSHKRQSSEHEDCSQRKLTRQAMNLQKGKKSIIVITDIDPLLFISNLIHEHD